MTSFIHETFVLILISHSVVFQTECSNNISVPKCQIGRRQSIVQCHVPTWHPYLLEDHNISRSAVNVLHIYFGEKDTLLTKQHLTGLENLESLVIVGHCVGRRKKVQWCKKPVGISAIELDAFDATPRLNSLTLKVHPLKNFNAIRRLHQLKYLHLRWMRSNNEFNASIFDNIRGSLKNLLLWYIPVKVINPEHFKNMGSLQKLEISAAKSLTIQAGGISNLPKLKSLHLASYAANSKFSLRRNAISNLTKLEHVSFYLLNRVCGTFHSSCSGIFNIVSISSFRSTPAIFDYCPQFLSCPKCGKDPHRYPQTIEIKLPIISKLYPGNHRLLPPNYTIPSYNTSRLFIFQPSVQYPFGMLRQMPLLKSFIVEYSNIVMGKSRLQWSFTRFRDNPLTQLPNTTRLNEIRITLKHCDCQLLEIIDWFKSNPRFDSNKSVNDVLKVDCTIIDGVCSDDEEGQPRQFIKWTDLNLLSHRLRPICKLVGKRTNEIRQVSPAECRCVNLESCEYKQNKGIVVMAFLFLTVSFMAVMVMG